MESVDTQAVSCPRIGVIFFVSPEKVVQLGAEARVFFV